MPELRPATASRPRRATPPAARPAETVTVPVLAVTDPATGFVNGACRRLHLAYGARLAADPRVRLVTVTDLAALAAAVESERPALVLNLSRNDVATLQWGLPPSALVVDFDYREGGAVQVPLSRLARRPLFVPGVRGVLEHPATSALTAYLYRGDGHCLGTLGQWEWRSHHKLAGRLSRALPEASYLVLDCFLAALHDGVPPEGYGPLRQVPEPPSIPPSGGKLRLVARYLRHLVVRTLRARLEPDTLPQWSIGVAAAAGPLDPDRPPAVRWVEPPPGRFLADPCLLAYEGRRVVFFEEKPLVGGVGEIMVADVEEDGTVRLDTRVHALRTGFHLSFPHAFRHEGGVYLLPEQGATWRLVLYRCLRFPDWWEPWVVLLEGFQAADPVLHHHEGHWYLFVSDAAHGNHDNHLQLFVAPTLAGPFRRHPASPVRFGLRGSRMAGALERTAEGLVRYGQECHEQYGGSISVFAVEELTPTTYRERFLRRLPPIPGAFSMAMHTCSRDAALLAVDGLRAVARPARGSA